MSAQKSVQCIDKSLPSKNLKLSTVMIMFPRRVLTSFSRKSSLV